MRVPDSIHRVIHIAGVSLVVILLLTSTVTADQVGHIQRRGFFKEITDSEASSFQIESFRMSADGSRVAYFGWNGSFNELRVIDGDGTDDTLVEEAEQYWGLLRGLYDISDDGSKIVYFRYTSLADPTPELVVYDVATEVRSLVFKLVPLSNWGTPDLWVVEPQEDPKLLRLSGDGTKVFFANRYGPYYGDPTHGFSGFSIYTVNIDGSGLDAVLEAKDIQNIPGIGPDSTSPFPWDGELATDYTGSMLAAPLSGSWGDTDLVTMTGDGSNPVVVQDLRGGSFHGPAMSGDGMKIVYSRGGTTDPADTGIFVTGTTLPQSPVTVTPASGYWGVFPEISSDGGTVVYNFDLGGGSSPAIRRAEAAGTGRLPITHPTVTATNPKAMVAVGGQTIFMVGTTTRSGYPELLRFDLSSTPFMGMPRVDMVTGNPDMSIGMGAGPHTFYYSTSGADLREMYSWPFTEDPALLLFTGFWGFNTNGYLYDDGGGSDVTAGDGIFTDDEVYLTEPPPGGLEFFTVRAGVASDNGVAAFSDYLCAFGDLYPLIFADGFGSGDTSAWGSTSR